SPQILNMTVATIGGTVAAVHATVVRDEVIGTSDGSANQRFQLLSAPVVPGDQPLVVETGSEEGWVPWEAVEGFGESGPDDHHVVVDPTAGEITFGPTVRLEDGSSAQHGARPEKGVLVRVPMYWTGGGSTGNVARGALSVLKSSSPYVSPVENRQPASGGGARQAPRAD